MHVNRRGKLTIGILAIIILAIFLNGCSIGSKGKEQGIDDEVLEDDVDKNTDGTELISGTELARLPDFDLQDLNGRRVSSDIFGDYSITIVNIWQSTCGPCIEEIGALKVIYDEYRDEDVNVLGISIDNMEVIDEEGLEDLLETMDVKYTNLIADDDYFMEIATHMRATPTTFIVDSKGELLMEAKEGSRGTEGDIEDFKNIIESLRQ